MYAIRSYYADDVIESFARCLLPSIQKYFDSEEGKREFQEWKINSGGSR